MSKNYSKYLIALLLFGSNGVVASFIDLSSYEIVLLRCVIGSAFLLTLFLFTKKHFTCLENRKDLIFIILSGVAMAADWLLLFVAYQRIGVSLGMMINYCGPVIVIALSPLILKVKITKQKALALFVTFIGALFISGNALSTGINFLGLLFAILSAFSYAGMIIFNKKAEKITGIENSVLQLLSACITVIIFVGIKQGLHVSITTHNIIPIIWLGLINTGFSCYLYFSSASKLPVQTVAISGYLEPVSACFMSFIILQEHMTIVQILGAALIILGAIYGERKKVIKQPKIPT